MLKNAAHVSTNELCAVYSVRIHYTLWTVNRPRGVGGAGDEERVTRTSWVAFSNSFHQVSERWSERAMGALHDMFATKVGAGVRVLDQWRPGRR